MYNIWINACIVLNLFLFACSEARAQGLVEARRPFESAASSSSSINADRQLELRLKLEEARARASQFEAMVPLASGFRMPELPPVDYRVFQLGDRFFIQQGEDVTTRKELREWAR